MQACKPVHSPALALPYELISQIFIHCLPLHRRIRPRRGCVPMRLSQICGQWRDVALATPQLWSSVYLKLAPGPQYDGISTLFDGIDPESVLDHTHDVLELWFTRAAGHPLSITIICAELGVGVPRNIMDLIAAHSAHWGRIELQVADGDFQAFNAISGPFPLLHSLAIRRTDQTLEVQALAVLLHGCPNLLALQLSSTLIMNPADLDVLPTSLTALQSVYWSANSNHFPMFERMPNLRHLSTLNYGTWDLMHGTGNPPTVIPSLRSLLVRGSPLFLDLIDTPALEYLGVELAQDYRSPNSTPIAAFLSRSRAWGQLTYLSLDVSRTHIGGVGLAECLAAVPTLATLELIFPAARARTQERYTFLQSADIVPRLRRLAITDSLHRDTSTPFLAVVRARPGLTHAELHMRTKHVHLRFTPPARDVLRELEALVARGTNIRITAPNYAWPLYSKDDDVVGVLDHNIFKLGSSQSRPHSFSFFD